MYPGAQLRLPSAFVAILTALLPLVFAAPLFDPYIGAKEVLLISGAAVAGALWLMAGGLAAGFPRTPAWAAAAALGIACTIAAWAHPSPGTPAAAARFLAAFVLFAVASAAMREPGARDTLATAITAAGMVEAVYVLCQAAFADPLLPAASLPGKWRAFGTLGNPNWAGEFLAVALFVAWGRLSARPDTRRVGIACLAVMGMALGATFARGAWLGCAIAVAACAALRGAPHVRRFAAAAVVPAVGAAALIAALRPDTVAFLANGASLRGRAFMWSVAARMIREAPWGGFGLGAFGLHFPRFQAEAFSQPWGSAFVRNASFTPHAHNEFLQLWAEAGILAPLALAALLCIVVGRGRAVARDPLAFGCWAGLFSLSVNLAYASPLYLPASLALFAVLAGTVEAAASSGTVRLPARPARYLAPVLAVILCALAFPFASRYAAGEIALARAVRALKRRDSSASAAALRDAQRHAPMRMETWVLAGRLYFANGRYDAAAEAFGRAAALGYDPQLFAVRSAALWYTGRRAEALSTLEELARLRPDLKWPLERLHSLRAAAPPVGSSL